MLNFKNVSHRTTVLSSTAHVFIAICNYEAPSKGSDMEAPKTETFHNFLTYYYYLQISRPKNGDTPSLQ